MKIIDTDKTNNTTKLARIVAMYKSGLDAKLKASLHNLAHLMSGLHMTDEDEFTDSALELLSAIKV